MSEPLYDGQLDLYAPTAARPYYRVRYRDTTGKQRFKNVGKTRQEALTRAAELIGIATPAHLLDPSTAPTVEDAFSTWLRTRTHRVSPRTHAYDHAIIKRYNQLHHERINRLTPDDLARLPTHTVSRATQKKVRSLWRQMLTAHRAWLHYTPEHLVDGIHISGTRRDDDRTQVDPSIIPTSHYIHTLLAYAWSTENPAIPTTTTSKQEGFTYPHPEEFAGVPETLLSRHMRATQKHYNDPDAFRTAERARAGRTYQTVAAIHTLAAGALMRIGEIMALRLRHVLDDRAIRTLAHIQTPTDFDTLYTIVNNLFTGHIRVEEQASVTTSGKMTVTRPKNARQRQTTLPSFLPAVDHARHLHAPASARARAFTQHEALTYWMEHHTPALRMILVTHIARIIQQWHTNRAPEDITLINLRNTLLFPTLAKARSIPDIAGGLTGYHGPDTLTGGGYRSNGNYRRIATPLMDYVSDRNGERPTSSRRSRTGYTIHGLRHYGISIQLKAARSIVDVSADAGHRTPAFTLQRYSHLIRDADAPFEF